MGWISWLCPGINLKRWLLLFAVGVLLCALGVLRAEGDAWA